MDIKYNVEDVANYFITFDPKITAKRLCCLLYMAYADYLIGQNEYGQPITDKLFDGRFNVEHYVCLDGYTMQSKVYDDLVDKGDYRNLELVHQEYLQDLIEGYEHLSEIELENVCSSSFDIKTTRKMLLNQRPQIINDELIIMDGEVSDLINRLFIECGECHGN